MIFVIDMPILASVFQTQSKILMKNAQFTALLAETLGIEETLYPFSVMHSSWELRYGGLRFFEVIQKTLQGFSLKFAGRNVQRSSFLEQEHLNDDLMQMPIAPLLVLRAEMIPENPVLTILRRMAIDGAQSFHIADEHGKTIGLYLMHDSEIARLNMFAQSFEEIIASFPCEELPTTTIPCSLISYQWETLSFVGKAIQESFAIFKKLWNEPVPSHVFALNMDGILIGTSTTLAPGIVLDASKGPIIIEEQVQIMAQSFIQGPCFIGKGSIIKAGAQIYGDTVVGPYCKIGGEVENSIIHGYSNKQHQGFLGHSYLGEWVNLGAMTTTSDLKNTYGEIDAFIRGKRVNTKRKFLGSLIGDHSKTAIGTSLSTGTVIGISSSVHDIGEFPPKDIKSFSWGTKESLHNLDRIYELEKACAVADTVMKRRGKSLTTLQKTMMEQESSKR